MLVVWTRKAEEDYRAKFPKRKNIRRAGTVAIYDGKPVEFTRRDNSIFYAYNVRGWVETIKEPGDEPPKEEKAGNCVTDEAMKERWQMMQVLFGSRENYTLAEIANMAGMSCSDSMRRFTRVHGSEMMKKYGKLPYKKGLKGLYPKYMRKPPREKPKVDKRVLVQNERWKIIIKDIGKRKKLDPPQT
jgi:AraC-like DNA-binding protein